MEHRLEWVGRGIAVLAAVMPFHAFLVIWAGHVFGHQAVFQAWKEVLILIMSFAVIAWLARGRHWRELDKPVNRLAAAFIGVALIVSLWHQPFSTTWWFGVKTDLVFVGLFILAQVPASRQLKLRLGKIILITGAIVAALAILQVTLISPNLLRQLGYGPTTIQPIQAIDPAIKAVRAFSTLGGPNQLGAFLILPLCFVTALIWRRRRWWQLPLGGLLLAALYVSYSRSAWIGALAGIWLVGLWELKRRRALYLVVSLALAGAALAAVVGLSRSHPNLRYYWQHADNATVTGSTAAHFEAIKRSTDIVRQQPLGLGLGSAGPASFHGANTLITENYYLQIAIETGLAGLVLFLAFEAAVAQQLWQRRNDHGLAIPLLATLAGVSIVDLFLHGWADSTLALVFWATAGVVIGAS